VLAACSACCSWGELRRGWPRCRAQQLTGARSQLQGTTGHGGGVNRKQADRTEVEDEGKRDISPPFFNLIHLQVGPIWCFGYIMASFKQVGNCSGTGAVS
jgi:hypothetical protein